MKGDLPRRLLAFALALQRALTFEELVIASAAELSSGLGYARAGGAEQLTAARKCFGSFPRPAQCGRTANITDR